LQHGNRRLVGYNQCGAWRHLWPLIEAAFTHATTETPAGQPRAGVFFETLAAVGAGLRSRALSFGTQNDWLRRIALSRLSVATCAVIAEGPGRLGDLADFHQARCTHHMFSAPHMAGFTIPPSVAPRTTRNCGGGETPSRPSFPGEPASPCGPGGPAGPVGPGSSLSPLSPLSPFMPQPLRVRAESRVQTRIRDLRIVGAPLKLRGNATAGLKFRSGQVAVWPLLWWVAAAAILR
jgi:hypothetical protein